jgi:hypothetical protein
LISHNVKAQAADAEPKMVYSVLRSVLRRSGKRSNPTLRRYGCAYKYGADTVLAQRKIMKLRAHRRG